ncbi:MAG: efflux RND transporter permease subunit [Proteobacteria bacterium]|nr:efflux RND transporter permease subunit [Pseudomonadota bacterium]
MKGAIAWFARNHVAANLLMLLMVAGGLAALPAIQQKSFPDVNVEVIQVGVTYLGAAPEEVEEGVCVRIEEEVQGIAGIEKLTSTASEGACGVTAELLSGYPVDRALSEIKNAVDGITTFPEETEKPVVSHFQIRRNALQIALSGDVPERTLKVWGERIRDQITALPGITQVELTNARPDEISIEVPEESLRRYGITFDDVVAAVRRGSLDRPGGSLKTESGEILLRTKGQAYRGNEFGQVVVRTREDGTRLLVADVARVRDGFEEEDRYARFNNEPAVLVKVYRVGDQKVLDLVASVKTFLAEVGGQLPAGLDLTVWRDGSQALRDRLDILIRNGRGGFILVFCVLALFLRLRLAFWVSIGVPIAFLGAIWMFPVLGVSIDVISLFAFILVLGLLVDDAIVVGENVHRHQENAEEPLAAAVRGAQEVSVPVIFGILTTVAAFLPLVLSPGPMGQIFGAIGIVVMACLFFSLVESQLVLPAHLGHMKVQAQEEAARARTGIAERWRRVQRFAAASLARFSQQVYRPALETVLDWRYSTLAAGVACLVLSMALVASGRLRFSFFPPVESDYATATLAMPQGTPVEETAAAVATLEAAALRVRAELDRDYPLAEGSLVKHVLASVGQQPSRGEGHATGPRRTASASHLGEVSLELAGGDARPIPARDVVARWRAATPPIPGVEELVFTSALFSAGDPIAIQLRSADVEQLRAASETLQERLATYPGVRDVSDSFREGKREILLRILPAAETLGITQDDLARQVRQAFYGAEAQRIQRGRDDVRVMVRYPPEERRSLADLEELRIRAPSGGEVPFYAVAAVERGRGYASIQRADRQRVISVTADVDTEQATAGEILADLKAGLLPELRAAHPGLSYDFEGEQREQAKTLAALIRNYGFAMLLIYALLAVPLRSYAQPLLIMGVIPFGMVGAIIGHVLMGKNISMMSVFGVVALSGVVVNASLVLVHTVNQRREEGWPLEQAVREAGVARFRPIVLTSLTTFAGLTPLLLERSVSAQFLIPMATSLAFGVEFATLISLFLLPSSYLVLEDLQSWLRRKESVPTEVDPGVEVPVRLRPVADEAEGRARATGGAAVVATRPGGDSG